MRTKNIIIILAALALCCFASSCVKQNDFDGFKEETDSHLSTVEGQMASLSELTATLGEEHDALKVYVAALGEGFEEYAAEVNDLLKELDEKLDAAEDTVENQLVKKDYFKSTFATITVVDSLSKVAEAIEMKVQADSSALGDSIRIRTEASKDKIMGIFGSYYTSAEINGKIKVLSDKLDTLSSDMDTAVFKHIDTLKTHVKALGASSIALAQKLDDEVAALKQQDTIMINQIKALDQKYLKGLQSLADSVSKDSARIEDLKSRVTKLEDKVQSVRVVPDYSDGKVNMKKGDTEIKFDVRPVSAAEALAAKTSAFSFQIIEALATTKASIYTDITVKSAKMSGADSLLVLTIDGTTMPAAFFDSTKFYNARLRISDAASGTDCSSSYFPLIKKGVTDLSANGSSNCYIVSEAGDYKFKAVKGNSTTSVGTVNNVTVLWESYGTSEAITIGALIQTGASYADDYITFTTGSQFPTKKGNAVIAAKDASNHILWSWHIWLADQPSEQKYNNSAGTMMDRNLGATSTEKGQVQALGLLYQWGRKDPFLGADTKYYASNPKQAASTGTWESVTSSTAETGTFDYAVKHPMQFIKCNNYNYDWYYTGTSTTDNTRWQTTKGLYDPCPVGWRVPDGGDSGVWCKAFNYTTAWTASENWDGENKGMDFGKTDKTLVGTGSDQCWYPAAGQRNVDGGSLGSVGSVGLYWSCAPDDNRASTLGFNTNGNVSPSIGSNRAGGLSVRCVKEK